MPSSIPLWTLMVGLAALIPCGCSRQTPSLGGREQAGVRPVAVRTVLVAEQEIQRTTRQPATVHSFYRAEVRARVNGYVQSVNADIGDVVKQGTPLAVIAVPEKEKQQEVLQAQITRCVSEEERAQAGVELAAADVRSFEARLQQAKSELQKTEASLAAVEAEFQRTEDLVQSQSLQRRVLDEVRKKRDSEIANRAAVAAAITSAEADVAVAKAKLSSSQADLKASQADTKIAQRQLEELDVLVGFATVTAPFDGVVTERSVELGNLVGAPDGAKGQPLFVVSQISKLRVQIPVPERDAALIRQGDAVSLTFPSFPDEQPIDDVVKRVSGDLDPNTRTMLVEVELENQDNRLLPGMFGQAAITLGAKTAANILPARAVRFSESGEAYVYVLDANDSVTVTPVKTGFDDGALIEVTQGVQSGQRVIDAHLKRFETGQIVALVD